MPAITDERWWTIATDPKVWWQARMVVGVIDGQQISHIAPNDMEPGAAARLLLNMRRILLERHMADSTNTTAEAARAATPPVDVEAQLSDTDLAEALMWAREQRSEFPASCRRIISLLEELRDIRAALAKEQS